MREPILIFAGNHAEAEHYARKIYLERKDWYYVTPHMLRGRKNPVVYIVGTYRDRPDFEKIVQALTPCDPQLLTIREWKAVL